MGPYRRVNRAPPSKTLSNTLNAAPVPQNRRLLQLLNSARSAADIHRILSAAPERGRGPNVAKRLLDLRNTLPSGRFSSPQELQSIQELDTAALEALENHYADSSATAFERALFENKVLLDNWTVLHHDWQVDTDEEFRRTVDDEPAFREVVRELAIRAAMETAGVPLKVAALQVEPLRHRYIDAYTNNTEEAALALALWFYRVDADNWFSFDRMLEQTRAYFSYHAPPVWEMELRLFKGIDNRLFLKMLVPSDIAVVVDYSERVVSLWIVGLSD